MILHLDMDAFFASVEQMDNPDLRGKPVIIGGKTRGVVATASYEARVFGIHSAMPMALARKLCPEGIFIRGRGSRYREISDRIFGVLTNFSPLVEPASIDEAYLDISGLVSLYSELEALASKIARNVAHVSGGLTCSIGIAPVKFLAKICSDINKPAGVFILRSEECEKFLAPLPIERLPGIGKRMAASLRGIGIRTVGELASLSRDFLFARYGKCGTILFERSHGIDPREVHARREAKSESAESTFPEDIRDKEELAKALLAHSEKVSGRLRRDGVAGRTITLKLKYSDFSQITRSRTLPAPTNATSVIYENARALLRAERLPLAVRLIGVGVSGFDRRMEFLPLPGLNDDAAGKTVDNAVDAICARYGKDAIKRAASIMSSQFGRSR